MNDIETSRVFSETAEAFAKGFRYIINKGGARSGKTFSILQFFLFLFSVKALSKVFRAKFCEKLKDKNLEEYPNIRQNLWEKSWVVYAKKPFGSPKSVVEYLGRYTHKIAIS